MSQSGSSSLAHAIGTQADHGTWVAGIIRAMAGLPNADGSCSSSGVAGANWDTHIIPVAIGDPQLKTAEGQNMARASLIIGINYAATQKADVINISAGIMMLRNDLPPDLPPTTCREETMVKAGDKFFTFRDKSIEEVRRIDVNWPGGEGKKSVLVIAAPNCPHDLRQGGVDSDTMFDPFIHTSLNNAPRIVVGGLNISNPNVVRYSELNAASNAHIHIAAPASNFNVTNPDGSVSQVAGNSCAAPLVSGALALMVAKYPALSGNAPARRSQLLCNARKEDELKFNVQEGRVLDAFAAASNPSCP